jgi:hypothetical protein
MGFEKKKHTSHFDEMSFIDDELRLRDLNEQVSRNVFKKLWVVGLYVPRAVSAEGPGTFADPEYSPGSG